MGEFQSGLCRQVVFIQRWSLTQVGLYMYCDVVLFVSSQHKCKILFII